MCLCARAQLGLGVHGLASHSEDITACSGLMGATYLLAKDLRQASVASLQFHHPQTGNERLFLSGWENSVRINGSAQTCTHTKC